MHVFTNTLHRERSVKRAPPSARARRASRYGRRQSSLIVPVAKLSIRSMYQETAVRVGQNPGAYRMWRQPRSIMQTASNLQIQRSLKNAQPPGNKINGTDSITKVRIYGSRELNREVKKAKKKNALEKITATNDGSFYAPFLDGASIHKQHISTRFLKRNFATGIRELHAQLLRYGSKARVTSHCSRADDSSIRLLSQLPNVNDDEP